MRLLVSLQALQGPFKRSIIRRNGKGVFMDIGSGCKLYPAFCRVFLTVLVVELLEVWIQDNGLSNSASGWKMRYG